MRQLRELGVKLEQLRIAQNQPLADQIAEVEKPSHLKYKLPTFTDESDPNRHINTIRSQVGWDIYDKGILCKVFEGMLQGIAQDWYYSLSMRSIESWSDLVSRFVRKFEHRAETRMTLNDLNILQKTGESMKDFWHRFEAGANKVLEMDELRVVESFLRGCLPHFRFVLKAYEQPIESLKECQQRIEHGSRMLEYRDRCRGTTKVIYEEKTR